MRTPENAWNPTMEVTDRDFMSVRAGVHAANQTDIVNDLSSMRKQFGDLRSTLPMLPKLERASQQFLAGLIHEAECDIPGVVCAVIL